MGFSSMGCPQLNKEAVYIIMIISTTHLILCLCYVGAYLFLIVWDKRHRASVPNHPESEIVVLLKAILLIAFESAFSQLF